MSGDQRFLFGWREAVFSSELTGTERHVLHVLSFHGDLDGRNCYPSLATLARKTGHNRKTCWRALQRAQELGWIKAEGRMAFDGEAAKGGRGHEVSTLNYRLAIPAQTGGSTPTDTTETVGTTPPVHLETVGAESATGGPVPQTGGPVSETGGTTPPNLIMISTSNSPSISAHAIVDEDEVVDAEIVERDDEDRISRLVRLRAEAIADERGASRHGRRAYVATTIQNMDRDRVAAVVTALADRSDDEIMEVLRLQDSKSPGDRTRARITLAARRWSSDPVPRGADPLRWPYDDDPRPRVLLPGETSELAKVL